MTWLYYLRRTLPLNPLGYFRELLIGVGALALGAALFIIPAILRPAPHPRECVRPTAFPATWFGECNRSTVNTYRNGNRR